MNLDFFTRSREAAKGAALISLRHRHILFVSSRLRVNQKTPVAKVIRKSVWAIALLASGAAIAAKPVALKTIPVVFRGDWAKTAAQCAPGPADSNTIRISARNSQSFESTGKVMTVKTIDAQQIIVDFRVTHSDASFGAQLNMKLSTDKKMLTIFDTMTSDSYVRCAK